MMDIRIYESKEGGDLQLVNDDLQTAKPLTNQVYIALFGGNKEASTGAEIEDLDRREDYWGNDFLEAQNQFNSRFERTLGQVALSTSGLKKLENAAKEDLSFLQDYADIEINISSPMPRKLELQVTIQEPQQQPERIKFVWDMQRNEIYQI